MVVLAGSFARKRMAPDIPNLRSDRRTAKQNLHELGSRKTKRGTKISRRGIKSEAARGMKPHEISLTVPSIDTVKARCAVVAVSI